MNHSHEKIRLATPRAAACRNSLHTAEKIAVLTFAHARGKAFRQRRRHHLIRMQELASSQHTFTNGRAGDTACRMTPCVHTSTLLSNSKRVCVCVSVCFLLAGWIFSQYVVAYVVVRYSSEMCTWYVVLHSTETYVHAYIALRVMSASRSVSRLRPCFCIACVRSADAHNRAMPITCAWLLVCAFRACVGQPAGPASRGKRHNTHRDFSDTNAPHITGIQTVERTHRQNAVNKTNHQRTLL